MNRREIEMEKGAFRAIMFRLGGGATLGGVAGFFGAEALREHSDTFAEMDAFTPFTVAAILFIAGGVFGSFWGCKKADRMFDDFYYPDEYK